MQMWVNISIHNSFPPRLRKFILTICIHWNLEQTKSRLKVRSFVDLMGSSAKANFAERYHYHEHT